MKEFGKILIVDDEPEFSDDLKKRLASMRYKVITADSRQRAQELAQAEKPDMIVLGTIGPRGDAFQLHQWLKRSPQFGSLPIIVIDATPEKQLTRGWNKNEGMMLETDDYYGKPVDTEALAARIETLVDRATRRIKVLVVDDHAIIREGIRALLALQKDIQVIGEAVDGLDALEKTIELSPDVVLMDIVMPVMNGLEATKRITKACDDVKVLILTQYDDDENVLASGKMGARGFIPKRSASSALLDGIRAVDQGQQFMHPITV
jgi:DNA-binding NarL/FixJ family response regulator